MTPLKLLWLWVMWKNVCGFKLQKKYYIYRKTLSIGTLSQSNKVTYFVSLYQGLLDRTTLMVETLILKSLKGILSLRQSEKLSTFLKFNLIFETTEVMKSLIPKKQKLWPH